MNVLSDTMAITTERPKLKFEETLGKDARIMYVSITPDKKVINFFADTRISGEQIKKLEEDYDIVSVKGVWQGELVGAVLSISLRSKDGKGSFEPFLRRMEENVAEGFFTRMEEVEDTPV